MRWLIHVFVFQRDTGPQAAFREDRAHDTTAVSRAVMQHTRLLCRLYAQAPCDASAASCGGISHLLNTPTPAASHVFLDTQGQDHSCWHMLFSSMLNI